MTDLGLLSRLAAPHPSLLHGHVGKSAPRVAQGTADRTAAEPKAPLKFGAGHRGFAANEHLLRWRLRSYFLKLAPLGEARRR